MELKKKTLCHVKHPGENPPTLQGGGETRAMLVARDRAQNFPLLMQFLCKIESLFTLLAKTELFHYDKLIAEESIPHPVLVETI